MAKSDNTQIEKMSYEAAYSELEKIVNALEAGDQTLEESLALFERGLALTRHCSDLLAGAELKIQTLSGEGLEPFKEDE